MGYVHHFWATIGNVWKSDSPSEIAFIGTKLCSPEDAGLVVQQQRHPAYEYAPPHLPIISPPGGVRFDQKSHYPGSLYVIPHKLRGIPTGAPPPRWIRVLRMHLPKDLFTMNTFILCAVYRVPMTCWNKIVVTWRIKEGVLTIFLFSFCVPSRTCWRSTYIYLKKEREKSLRHRPFEAFSVFFLGGERVRTSDEGRQWSIDQGSSWI